MKFQNNCEASDLSRREAILGLGSLMATSILPKSVMAAERNEVRRKMGLPEFHTYQNPQFGRAEHEAFHAQLEKEYAFAVDTTLTRWNSDPTKVYVNEKAGESIHITGVNLAKGYVEMIWVLAPAYRNEKGEKVVAHVPFEHQHSNQAEEFEKISGELAARVNGVILEGEDTEFFVAHPEDDHIAWNSNTEPLAMRVRYSPGFDQDGERALMVYWGFVNEASRVKEKGQPANFALLGALNAHLAPQAIPSKMPTFLPEVAKPFLVNSLNRKQVADLYRELTKEEHPLA